MPDRSVLVVDDSVAFQDFARVSFQKAGWHVTISDSLASAATALADTAFSAVVLDFRFPEGNGLDLLQSIRKNLHDVAVVMVSGDCDFRTGVRAMKLGADDFLEKPMSAGDLVDAVDSAAAGRNSPLGPVAPDAHRRVAELIMLAARADQDIRSIGVWARAAGQSRQMLQVRCSRIGATAKRALDLGRLLRVCLQDAESRRLEWQLGNSDVRTIDRLLLRTGLSVHDVEHVPPVSFLRRQQMVTSPELVETLIELMRAARDVP